MTTTEQYRINAESCLERARTDRNEGDRPLWITLAQSWLQLAAHADRVNREVSSETHERERDAAGDRAA
ncbi:MAG: hypothetical protein ACRECO_03325 [Xanthobacteraceae bacterium]